MHGVRSKHAARLEALVGRPAPREVSNLSKGTVHSPGRVGGQGLHNRTARGEAKLTVELIELGGGDSPPENDQIAALRLLRAEWGGGPSPAPVQSDSVLSSRHLSKETVRSDRSDLPIASSDLSVETATSEDAPNEIGPHNTALRR
jgi:hypothetical protein